MKKITLIEPSPPNYHIFSFFNIPRLGLPIIGTILKNQGYDVNIYVESIHPIDYADVYKSDLVGISSITSTAPKAYEIAEKVSQRGIPVVMGGTHATFLPDEALKYVDYVVRGEGEETITELLENLEQNKSLNNISGLSYKKNGIIQHNSNREFIKNLDVFPFPDISLIKGLKKLSSIPISTSRGCPYNCSFCSVTSMFGQKYRFRSVDNIIEEIMFNLSRTNNREIFFYDDNFTASQTHTIELLEKLIRKNIKIHWTAQTRWNVTKNKELLDLMRRTNCWYLYIGLESINPKTLELYNKKQRIDEIKQAIGTLHKYKIKVHGMFVLGSDADDVRTIRDTVRFSNKNKVDSVQYLILIPLPGSQTFNQMVKEGRLLIKKWNFYDGMHAVFKPVKMSAYRLQIETIKAMRKFYSLLKSIRELIKWHLYSAGIIFFANLLIKRWLKTKKDFIKLLKCIEVQDKFTKNDPFFIDYDKKTLNNSKRHNVNERSR